MSTTYKAVGWNAFKRRYDLVLTLVVLAFVAVFTGFTFAAHPSATPEIVLMRATGTCAILLLHLILIIGPLARLDRRWLPLLYNRRHLGVTTFLVALAHGLLVVLTYHAGGEISAIASIFTADAGLSFAAFPFQAFGFAALFILFVMAATSHDFWLANLTAPVWKTLHMLVYPAYAAVLIHVCYGVLQAELSPLYAWSTVAGLVTVAGLHLSAGMKERAADQPQTLAVADDGFLEVCAVEDVPRDAAHGVMVGGERVAIVRWGDKLSAVSGVCQHQNGPLAEGRFIFGCLTCPWHGYQYRPDTGVSPPPFTEKLPTFRIRVHEGKVFVHPQANPPGTPVEPVSLIPQPNA